jgi:hypothetical protein
MGLLAVWISLLRMHVRLSRDMAACERRPEVSSVRSWRAVALDSRRMRDLASSIVRSFVFAVLSIYAFGLIATIIKATVGAVIVLAIAYWWRGRQA